MNKELIPNSNSNDFFFNIEFSYEGIVSHRTKLKLFTRWNLGSVESMGRSLSTLQDQNRQQILYDDCLVLCMYKTKID
jgi:hypothetical protein